MAKYTSKLIRGVHTGANFQVSHRLPHQVRHVHCSKLSREAGVRLQFLEYARDHSVSATCRHYGIARSTFYRWKTRFDPHRLESLENRSACPHRRRQATWSVAEVQAVQEMRETYPRYGKDKLRILLAQQGIVLSVSRVGRIITSLKRRGVLNEPPIKKVWRDHRRHSRPYAVRKPREYEATQPGTLVQLDTMDLRPFPWLVRKHFTAIDVVSRWSVTTVRAAASARTARDFLDTLLKCMPFSVQGIQVDGGSEFMAEFETACQERGIKLFVLPPRSPKLNGRVERCNRTCRQEFYECYTGDLDLPTLQAALLEWEHVYNHQRPHQALGYATPASFLQQSGSPHL